MCCAYTDGELEEETAKVLVGSPGETVEIVQGSAILGLHAAASPDSLMALKLDSHSEPDLGLTTTKPLQAIVGFSWGMGCSEGQKMLEICSPQILRMIPYLLTYASLECPELSLVCHGKICK